MNNRQNGFTFVEMVVVVILVGIIAAVTMSRILRDDTYNALLARDQITSLARSAQQRAIGRSDVYLQIQSAGNNLTMSVGDSTGELQQATLSNRSLTLAADVNQTASCGSTPGASTVAGSAVFRLNYDELGNLLDGGVSTAVGYPVTIADAARFCIDNDPVFSICWSDAGYPYVGDCRD
jgi:MSHA pilin protein MshC